MVLPTQGPRWLESAKSVSAITWALKRKVEADFRSVLITGEVAAERFANGHLYFVLKDNEAQIPCTIWRSTLNRIHTRIHSGQHLAVRGDIQIYAPHGRYQLIVSEAHDIGRGAIFAELAALAEKLQAEGLFAAERKRPLPLLPRRIGLVTAAQGAALQDVLRILSDRFPVNVLLCASRVQGEGAGAEIAAAVRRLQDIPEVDVIIVTRGGGSPEDLHAFNDEGLVRAIAACPKPVISAVGHEIDTVLTDLVADATAPTPTAAAAMVVPQLDTLKGALDQLDERMSEALARRLGEAAQRIEPLTRRLGAASERRLQRERLRVDRIGHRLALAGPKLRLERLRARLVRADESLKRASTRDLEARQRRLSLAQSRLAILSPLASLDRGYAIVRKEGGAVVTRAADVSGQERLEVIVHDGRFAAKRCDDPE